jgi:serpin B
MKRINPLPSLLFLIIVFASCHKDTRVNPKNLGPGIDLVLSSTEQQNAAADNAFTFNLFKAVQTTNTGGNNLFISPLSVSMALGMTANGANGGTLDAINQTLGFGGFSEDEKNGFYKKLMTDLPRLDPNTTLNIANSIWYRQGFSVLPQFLTTDSASFKARIQSLDFSNPSSVNTINNWVSGQTNGKIPKIIDAISPDDIMYLVNAIYFKSTWKTKFDAARTTQMPFTLADNSQVQASFMKASHVICNSYTDDTITLLELPYANSKYSMVIALPPTGKSVSDILPSFSGDQWQTWAGKLLPTTIDVTMPKFKFSYGIKMNNILSDLGMGVAFGSGADFSRINAGGGLQISSVDHKAFVLVDETGTEAAAATSISVGITAVLQNQITIDRPFVFVIREMKTGLILFTGIVNNPNLAGS